MTDTVEVAVGILLRDGDSGPQYLLAQRPPGKVYAGYWEFPGGKVEPGETHRAALDRELMEELGIGVENAWPWLSREFTYPHARVRLKFFRVTAWRNEISPIEHTGMTWVGLGQPAGVEPVLPANGPILRALDLPTTYAITCAEDNGIDAELARLHGALEGGLRLVQIRDKTLAPETRRRFALEVMALARHHPGTRVLVNGDVILAQAIGADGVHLSAAQIKESVERPPFAWIAASCHNAVELARAARAGVDFAVLGPICPTQTHPDTPTLGWAEFAAEVFDAPIPVFGLGGLTPEDGETACRHGAHGVALMRAWR